MPEIFCSVGAFYRKQLCAASVYGNRDFIIVYFVYHDITPFDFGFYDIIITYVADKINNVTEDKRWIK